MVLAATVLGAGARADAFKLGYIDRRQDPAYQETRGYAGVFRREHASPLPAAELAVKDGMAAARAAGMSLALIHRSLEPGADAGSALEALVRERAAAIVVDLPLSELEHLAKAPAARSVALINARHRDDGLRQATCRTSLLHTMPSWSMLTDALAQGLVGLNWRRILVLRGPDEEDAIFADPFLASAKKFGLRIADTRAFVLGNDPRKRDQSNVRLLTGNADYDVIFVADRSGEFARYVPYNTARARPVIGSTGLRPLAWHAYWERHGAPQLNRRFHRLAARPMSEEDWATWIAVRAVLDAAVAARDASPAAVLKSLMSADLRLELYKGLPGSFRPWSRQLRQAILLGTQDAVIALAPLEGALHQTNTLDTLGPDQPEFTCP
jgi:ABC transporter substrate binding protein (PQQ-dependent alcohol dehydrogenase system)